MKFFHLYILVVLMVTACGFNPKSKTADYPRACTEEDVSVSVRDRYFKQVENFLDNYYMLALEVDDKDMTEDFVANFCHNAVAKNFLNEFMKSSNKSEYFSPFQYLMEYNKAFQPFNRDELNFTLENFSHEKDMYMLSIRSCYTISDYDLTLYYGGNVIFKSRCRAVCVFPKASSYLTVKLMQVEPVSNVVHFDNKAFPLSAPMAVVSADTIATISNALHTNDEASVKETNVNVNVKVQEGVKTSNTINGHEFVDLGLSVKWATCNVGASKPEEPGDYFAWGEIRPKQEYTEYSYSHFDSGFVWHISDSIAYDAARYNWGLGWRMPTEKELQELVDNCIWNEEVLNGTVGYRIIGPYGKSIFLPAAGIKHIGKVIGLDISGYYWSGSIYNPNKMKVVQLYFSKKGRRSVEWCNKYFGRTIRPVAE